MTATIQGVAAEVICLAHRYDVRHVLEACTAFLTSPKAVNALSGDPASDAYALKWLHVGEKLQLDAVAKRWVGDCVHGEACGWACRACCGGGIPAAGGRCVVGCSAIVPWHVQRAAVPAALGPASKVRAVRPEGGSCSGTYLARCSFGQG